MKNFTLSLSRVFAQPLTKEKKMLNTIPQTKEKLGLGVTKIYQLINENKLRAKKIGRRTFVSEEDIQAFIASLEDYPTQSAKS